MGKKRGKAHPDLTKIENQYIKIIAQSMGISLSLGIDISLYMIIDIFIYICRSLYIHMDG